MELSSILLMIVMIIMIFILLFGLFFFLMASTYDCLIKEDHFFIQRRSDLLILQAIKISSSILLTTLLISLVFHGISTGTLSLLTLTLATLGWLFSNFISSKNSIRQHTVTILTQMRMSTEFMKNANLLQPLLENNQSISFEFYKNLINTEKGLEQKNAIRYLLNYLEFVSAGIRYGDLDENLVKAAQRGMFVNSYKMCELYIKEINTQSPSTFEHFICVIERWNCP